MLVQVKTNVRLFALSPCLVFIGIDIRMVCNCFKKFAFHQLTFKCRLRKGTVVTIKFHKYKNQYICRQAQNFYRPLVNLTNFIA